MPDEQDFGRELRAVNAVALLMARSFRKHCDEVSSQQRTVSEFPDTNSHSQIDPSSNDKATTRESSDAKADVTATRGKSVQHAIGIVNDDIPHDYCRNQGSCVD